MLTERSKAEWTQKIKHASCEVNKLILERLALQQATREIHRLYKVTKIMASEWRDLGCDDEELIEAQIRRVAQKVGMPATEVLYFLSDKVRERAKALMEKIDGSTYTAALRSSEALCADRVLQSTSEMEAKDIYGIFSRFAYGLLCGSLRREVKPISEEDLNQCGKPFPRVMARPAIDHSRFEFTAENDDEIPF